MKHQLTALYLHSYVQVVLCGHLPVCADSTTTFTQQKADPKTEFQSSTLFLIMIKPNPLSDVLPPSIHSIVPPLR